MAKAPKSKNNQRKEKLLKQKLEVVKDRFKILKELALKRRRSKVYTVYEKNGGKDSSKSEHNSIQTAILAFQSICKDIESEPDEKKRRKRKAFMNLK